VTLVRAPAAGALAGWLLLGLLFGLLMGPYQAISELGFRLQRGLWLAVVSHQVRQHSRC
jgi:hypothetical protein